MIEDFNVWLLFYGVWVVVCMLLSVMIVCNKGMKLLLVGVVGFVVVFILIVGLIYLVVLGMWFVKQWVLIGEQVFQDVLVDIGECVQFGDGSVFVYFVDGGVDWVEFYYLSVGGGDKVVVIGIVGGGQVCVGVGVIFDCCYGGVYQGVVVGEEWLVGQFLFDFVIQVVVLQDGFCVLV